MSRFFKALEQAERDRMAHESGAPRPSPTIRPATDTVVADAAARPARRISTPRTTREHGPSGDVDGRLVSLLTPASFEAEQYRALRHLIEARRSMDGTATIAVSSPAVGDGKTLTAINLAGTLAQGSGARVLLIDADLRRPSVARALGLRSASGGSLPGLVDAILEPTLGLEAVRHACPEFNLDVVPAGGIPEKPYELLQSARFAELLVEARQRYDSIVIDTPPLVAVPDGRVLEKLVDGIILVISAHQTPRRLVEEALSLTNPAKALGIVFNRDDRPLTSYYRGYHDGEPVNGHGASGLNRMLRRARGNSTRS